MVESAPKVLVVEDEESFVEALTSGLRHEGFVVDVARDGEEALDLFDTSQPDVVLLDIMLPKMSGIDVCREIRNKSQVPIIMVTARAAEIDTVVGLEVGADDYVAKPFRLRELVARMRAVMRRTSRADVPGEDVDAMEIGPVRFDPVRHEVFIRGDRVALPLKEFELLGMLLSGAGRVLSRDAIIKTVWGEDYVGDTKTLDVHIKRLRSKVEENPSEPVFIKTVRGLGYKFDATSELSSVTP
jgi:two-component system response regulator RegX3